MRAAGHYPWDAGSRPANRCSGRGSGVGRERRCKYTSSTALGPLFFCPLRNALTEEREGTALSQPSDPTGGFQVRLQTNRRTAVLGVDGELDLATVGQFGDAFESLNLDADGFRHVVLDLRGLTFMDATGIGELLRQNRDAAMNRCNFAVVRGRESISRLLAITNVDAMLVLVDSPEDLAPPIAGAPRYRPV